jgi:predicted Zn finger-like uncharacterized protein
MLITCPSCASAYDLPAERIGGTGRKVRCASCRESWFVASPEDKLAGGGRPALESEAERGDFEIVTRPVPSPHSPRPEVEASGPPAGRSRARAGARRGGPSRKKGAGALRVLVRAAVIGAVCLAPPILLADRHRVVAAMPGTNTLYRAIGLPVNLVGLSFTEVRSTTLRENDAPVLEVTGEILNDGRVARGVPPLQITLEGGGGEALYSWSARAVDGELAVGQRAPFRVRLTAPPPEARQVVVTFREDRARHLASSR